MKNSEVKKIFKNLQGITLLAIAIIITVYTPLYDESRLFLPFSAVIVSFLLFGRISGIITAIVGILAIDFFYIGQSYQFDFNFSYILEAGLFLLIGFLIYKIINERDRAKNDLLKLKDEFLFTTVHDLRSPLATISLILNDKKEIVKNDLMDIKKSLKKVVNLVSRLIVMAQSESPYIHEKKEKVNVEEVIKTILRRKEREMSFKKIEARFNISGGDFSTKSDPLAIDEIFDNLIENAIKYNKDNGLITITGKANQDSITIEIADTGVGITEDNLQKIFLPYFRGDIQNPGTGLGLYIVKKLIDQNKGEISVESSVDSGSTFTVTLPREQA